MSKPNKVLFVTVGTSALKAEELGKDLKNDRGHDLGDKLRDQVKSYLRNPGGLQITARVLFDQVVKAHACVWKQLKEPPNLHVQTRQWIGEQMDRTSAEMTSTFLMFRSDGAPAPCIPADLQVVLLASDTPDGQLAARINATLMHRFLLIDPCGCTPDANGSCQHSKVVVVCVPGLDVENFTGSVSDGLVAILDRFATEGKNAKCNITGGFKGTIPTITSWAFNRIPPACLYYQHVNNRDCVMVEFDIATRCLKESQLSRRTAPPIPERLG